MNETTIYLLLYFTNLAFIVTNIYGWILKEFYTAKPYREHFEALFPAQRVVGFLYLAQLMEIPYLLMMGQPKALFYINAFSMLFFASMMVVIGEGYFFWRKYIDEGWRALRDKSYPKIAVCGIFRRLFLLIIWSVRQHGLTLHN